MDKQEWQGRIGETWAAQYRRTDRSFTQLTEHLLSRTRDVGFRHAADVGCGAGELSLAIARGRHDAQVVGIDVSPDLIAVARERAVNFANVTFEETDAAEWVPAQDTAPDLVVSRHGVMFFDDPPAAFAHLAGQSAPAASLLFSCFRTPEENPYFTEVLRLLPDPPSPGDSHAPGPFAFADRDHVSRILEKGGWEDIRFDRFDFPMILASGEDAIEDAVEFVANIGVAARLAAELESSARARFFDRVRDFATRHCYDNLVALPAAAWIATARKA